MENPDVFLAHAAIQRVLVSLCSFLADIRLVLHDDWEYTEAEIQHNATSAVPSIHPTGTFLEPGVSDESNNWGNRGALLRSYRELVEQLGFIPGASMSFTEEQRTIP